MNGQFCTVAEASTKVGVHPKTIRRYIYDGKLSARKIGREWQVSEDSIDDLLNQCSNGSCSTSTSEDDFCVFMDNDSFESDDEIQVCSIVDIYIENGEIVTKITNEINSIVNNYDKSEKFKYNYVYDNTLKKTRLIFWGPSSFMKIIMNSLSKYK